MAEEGRGESLLVRLVHSIHISLRVETLRRASVTEYAPTCAAVVLALIDLIENRAALVVAARRHFAFIDPVVASTWFGVAAAFAPGSNICQFYRYLPHILNLPRRRKPLLS